MPTNDWQAIQAEEAAMQESIDAAMTLTELLHLMQIVNQREFDEPRTHRWADAILQRAVIVLAGETAEAQAFLAAYNAVDKWYE